MVANGIDSDAQQKQWYQSGAAVQDNADAHQSPEEAALVPGNLQQRVRGRHSGTQERWSLAELVCEHVRPH